VRIQPVDPAAPRHDNHRHAPETSFDAADRVAPQGILRPPGKAAVLARIPPDRLADILDIAEDGVVTVDARQEIVLFNRGAAKLFGYDPDEVAGRPLDLLIPERFHHSHRDQVAEFGRSPESARAMGMRREVCGRRKDGSEFPAEVSISKFTVGGELLFTAIIRDVAERKRYEAAGRELEELRTRAKLAAAEAAVRDSETQYRRIVETANEGIWVLDADARVTFVNGRMAEMLGLTPGEVIGRRKWDFVFEEDLPAVRALFERRRAGASEQADVRFRRRDGAAVWALMSARPVVGDGGEFRGCLDMFTEVTERKKWEATLALGEERLRLALDAGLMGAWEWDRNSGRVHWDGTLFGLLGVPETSAPLTIESFFDRVHPEDRAALRRQLTAAADSGGQFEGEFRIVRPDGEVRWLVCKGRVSRAGSDESPKMHGVSYDVTDRRRAEDNLRETTRQLWQAARLAGVGELAASIAHELNNPLGTVALRVERLLAKTPADDPRRRSLEVVEGEVGRMGDLVSNLLQFSRAGRDQVSTVDVPEEITKTLELVGHHLRKRQIRVEPDFGPGVPHIQADRQQLRQVFLNLFTNAADAMPAGGRLIPRVQPGRLSADAPAVVVEVADTGVGIPPDVLNRVFEPFFTTKDEGKGTGLGLAICRRIVQQHRGTLEIESRTGLGTTVRVTLPVRQDTNVAGLHSD